MDMAEKPSISSELKQIRVALGLSQGEMMDALALGMEAQTTLSGYEKNPKKRGYPAALVRAKEVYKARTGEDWKTPGTIDERGLGRLEGLIEAQGKDLARLRRRVAEAFVLIQDLGRRAGIELPPLEPVE